MANPLLLLPTAVRGAAKILGVTRVKNMLEKGISQAEIKRMAQNTDRSIPSGITREAFKKLGGGNISSLVNKLRRRGLSEDALIREIEAIAARGKAPYDQFVKTGAGKSLKQQGFKRKGVNETTREQMKQFGLAKARENAAKKNNFKDGGEVCKKKTRRGMGIATRGGGAVS